jgi:hypothetical protein
MPPYEIIYIIHRLKLFVVYLSTGEELFLRPISPCKRDIAQSVREVLG